MDNRKLVAILEEVGLKGSGPPSGTPPRAGLIYTDTTNGTRYLSRNVLDLNNSSFITLPTLSNVQKVEFKFFTSQTTISTFQPYFEWSLGDADRINLERRGDTSNLSFVNSTAVLNGSSISNNVTNPTANLWNRIALTSVGGVPKKLDLIGRGTNANSTRRSQVRIADFRVLGTGDTLLASYSIDEGSGTAIIDSVSGQNGTLTLGSGSWQLDWVPLN
jgi:hypothetical protein